MRYSAVKSLHSSHVAVFMVFFIVNTAEDVTPKVPVIWLLVNNETFNASNTYNAKILCFFAASHPDLLLL